MDDSAREKLRILILDNRVVVRWGIRQVLAEAFEHFDFSEGAAGPTGLDMALGQPWDLIVVATDVPDREQLRVLADLKKMRPDQPTLVFTARAKSSDAAVLVRNGGSEHRVGCAT